jgi:hypothetical protein
MLSIKAISPQRTQRAQRKDKEMNAILLCLFSALSALLTPDFFAAGEG